MRFCVAGVVVQVYFPLHIYYNATQLHTSMDNFFSVKFCTFAIHCQIVSHLAVFVIVEDQVLAHVALSFASKKKDIEAHHVYNNIEEAPSRSLSLEFTTTN